VVRIHDCLMDGFGPVCISLEAAMHL